MTQPSTAPKAVAQAIVRAMIGVALVGFLATLFYDPIDPPQDRPVTGLSFDGPKQLTILGTSLTADYGWPEQLDRCTQVDLSVTKIAKGGAGSDWGRSQLDAVSATNPDIVVVEFAINDADLRRRISLQESQENHRAILSHLHKHNPEAEIILMTMNAAYGLRRYLLRPRLTAYYALYQDFASEFETGLLDLYPRWRSLDKAERDQADGLHPSQEAAARVILPALSRYLAVPLDPVCVKLDHS